MSQVGSPGRTRRVGLLGHGSINSVVAAELLAGRIRGAELSASFTRSPDPAVAGSVRSIDALIESSDLIVEAAGQEALAAHGPAIVTADRDLLIVSTGALRDEALLAELAAGRPGSVCVSGGAIGGLDMIRAAAAMGPLRQASITSTKKPSSLLQPWMDDGERERLEDLDGPETLFRGDSRELVALFPTSTNVAATLALAVGSWDLVEAAVVADPGPSRTTHLIEVDGEAGSYRFEMSHVPSAVTPSSSGIVPWAVVRALQDLVAPTLRFT